MTKADWQVCLEGAQRETKNDVIFCSAQDVEPTQQNRIEPRMELKTGLTKEKQFFL